MNENVSSPQRASIFGLVGGVIFLGLAVLNWFEGAHMLTAGFTAIGIAVIVRTPVCHRLFGLDYDNPGTSLWILSYVLSVVSGIAFLMEIFHRLLH